MEKDLGVIFDKDLIFDKHTQKAISTASKLLGMVKRSFVTRDSFVIISLYKSMIRPHLEYGNSVWHPQFKRQSVALERVQRRTTKLIPHLRTLPYAERLKILNLPSLKFRRIRGDLIQAFKIFSGTDDIKANDIFTQSSYSSTRNSIFKIFKRHSRTTKRSTTFSYRVTNLWNDLSNNTKQAKNTDTFKNLLTKENKIYDLKYIFD